MRTDIENMIKDPNWISKDENISEMKHTLDIINNNLDPQEKR